MVELFLQRFEAGKVIPARKVKRCANAAGDAVVFKQVNHSKLEHAVEARVEHLLRGGRNGLVVGIDNAVVYLRDDLICKEGYIVKSWSIYLDILCCVSGSKFGYHNKCWPFVICRCKFIDEEKRIGINRYFNLGFGAYFFGIHNGGLELGWSGFKRLA